MSGKFDWRLVYPRSRIVTLILDPEEARELLAQAADEGRVVSRGVVRGMPAIAFSERVLPAPDNGNSFDMDEVEDDEEDGAEAAGAGPIQRAGDAGPDHVADRPADGPEPKGAVLLFTGVWREPIKATDEAVSKAPSKALRTDPEPRFPAGSILAEQPPRRDREPAEPEYRYFPNKGKVKRGTISAEDRKLVDQALAEGRVTKCPPGHSRAEYAPAPGGDEWVSRAKALRGNKNSALKRSRKEVIGDVNGS